MKTFSIKASGRTSRKREHTKWHWTPEEDDLLISLIQVHGPVKWDKIATHIHGRTGKSCRIRWLNQLSPGVDKTPFSPEEKQRLVLLHREFGNRWSTIVSHFPGRTDNQVKNQYHILAGPRYSNKAAGSSFCNDPNLNDEFRGFSQIQNLSMAPVDSLFSDVTSQGANNHCFAPVFPAMPGRVEMCPPFIAGSSSVYGKGESPTQVGAPSSILSSLGPHPHERPSYGSSMVSDANSASIKSHQLIDFLGIGSS